MTLLTQQRGLPGQHGIVITAVRAMAQGAVFGCRCVLPEKGAALFRVTGITGLVDGCFPQQKVVVAVVRVMAIAATHTPEPERVIAASVDVGATFLVTGKTGFLLGQGIQNRVRLAVDLVTGGAWNGFSLVRAAKPTQSAMGLVTTQAHFVLLPGRGFCPDTKQNRR